MSSQGRRLLLHTFTLLTQNQLLSDIAWSSWGKLPEVESWYLVLIGVFQVTISHLVQVLDLLL